MGDFFKEFIEKTSVSQFAKMIDHTLLKPDASYKVLEKYIDDTKRYGFKLLMLPLSLVPKAREIAGGSIELGVVVGFPLGNTSTRAKLAEIDEAIQYKVDEVDMVMNLNAFKSGDYGLVLNDMHSVVEHAKRNGVKAVKVIIETGLLSDEEKVSATKLVIEAGADYVKTCTGFLGGVATIHDVRLLWKTASGKVKVKASGGVRFAHDAIALVLAGAERIGTSSGDKIIEEYIRIREKGE